MLHDRDEDDKYEGSDEPEYHFTDEESGDYVDTEIPKEPAPSSNESASKSGAGIKALAPSKRMMISLVVFLGLVYVVYKMVAPSTPVPSTDIVTAQATQAKPAQPPKEMSQQAPTPQVVPAAAAPVVAPPPVVQVQAPPPPPAQQPPGVETTTSPLAGGQIMPVGQPSPNQVAQAPIAQPSQQPPQQPVMLPQQAAGPVPPQSMVPVQTMPSPPPVVEASVLNPVANDAKITALQADSAKLISQLQADYVQKLNDFSTQNKALQDEIQTLNSRMSAMETQINQLVQALTRSQGGAMNTNEAPVPVEQQAIEPRLSFNVQAIIPGRAWLRSDNGETLTVAEGDVVKSLGRVTKIDPYDGVVEINTGNKVVSLSYGTSA